ncbi:hypothetical protein SO802_012659 [Lithocarpus litseifolius]|uniref:DUF7796 domain-containing protein n=1 Tax=Lithocarpus litseifolius TaxID=425828 RepID=A0AAW2D5X4_9ROSI
MVELDHWRNGMLQLCDAHGDWEKGWEKIFDRVAGKKLVELRKRVKKMKLKQCVDDFEEMKKKRSRRWESLEVEKSQTIMMGLSIGLRLIMDQTTAKHIHGMQCILWD